MAIKSYKDLLVWQKGIEIVDQIYLVVKNLPKSEQYVLSSQMLRAAISIPSNIAEGYRRGHRAEYVQFLSIALASAAELETQLVICKKQYYGINYITVEILLDEIQKMLFSLINKVKG